MQVGRMWSLDRSRTGVLVKSNEPEPVTAALKYEYALCSAEKGLGESKPKPAAC